jgi:hypothetical protein
VASKNYQEIHGGALNDIIQKARHTAGTRRMFRRIHDNEEGRGVFNEEGLMGKGLVVAVWIPSDGKDVPYTSEST